VTLRWGKRSVRSMLAVLLPSLRARAQAVRDGLHSTQNTEVREWPGQGQEMKREIFAALHLSAFVETGTFRGSTTEFQRAESKIPVFTVEIDPPLFPFLSKAISGQSRWYRTPSHPSPGWAS
jgi:hypothetical protein